MAQRPPRYRRWPHLQAAPAAASRPQVLSSLTSIWRLARCHRRTKGVEGRSIAAHPFRYGPGPLTQRARRTPYKPPVWPLFRIHFTLSLLGTQAPIQPHTPQPEGPGHPAHRPSSVSPHSRLAPSPSLGSESHEGRHTGRSRAAAGHLRNCQVRTTASPRVAHRAHQQGWCPLRAACLLHGCREGEPAGDAPRRAVYPSVTTRRRCCTPHPSSPRRCSCSLPPLPPPTAGLSSPWVRVCAWHLAGCMASGPLCTPPGTTLHARHRLPVHLSVRTVTHLAAAPALPCSLPHRH